MLLKRFFIVVASLLLVAVVLITAVWACSHGCAFPNDPPLDSSGGYYWLGQIQYQKDWADTYHTTCDNLLADNQNAIEYASNEIAASEACYTCKTAADVDLTAAGNAAGECQTNHNNCSLWASALENFEIEAETKYGAGKFCDVFWMFLSKTVAVYEEGQSNVQCTGAHACAMRAQDHRDACTTNANICCVKCSEAVDHVDDCTH